MDCSVAWWELSKVGLPRTMYTVRPKDLQRDRRAPFKALVKPAPEAAHAGQMPMFRRLCSDAHVPTPMFRRPWSDRRHVPI
jgi:hypothetical protein